MSLLKYIEIHTYVCHHLGPYAPSKIFLVIQTDLITVKLRVDVCRALF